NAYFTACAGTLDSGKVMRIVGPPWKAEPFVGFDGTSSCGEIAADPGPNGSLYWISDDSIMTSRKDNPVAGAKLAAQGARRLVVDDEFIYWLNDAGEIWRGSKHSADPPTRIGSAIHGYGLAVDCENIYWTDSLGTTTDAYPSPSGPLALLRAAR